MKWIARISVFLAALVIGTATCVMTKPNGLSNCVVHFEPYSGHKSSIRPDNITVMYAGMTQDIRLHEPVLKFVIYNGWSKRVSYFAKSPGTPYPELRLGGRKLAPPVYSATGMESYDIEPGASAEVRVYPFQFPERPRKGDYVTVGYLLTRESGGPHEMTVTPPFILPAEFSEAIEPVSK